MNSTYVIPSMSVYIYIYREVSEANNLFTAKSFHFWLVDRRNSQPEGDLCHML